MEIGQVVKATTVNGNSITGKIEAIYNHTVLVSCGVQRELVTQKSLLLMELTKSINEISSNSESCL
ncbi:hypothetical protein A5844_002185 [Enterococcus sp. 10A9_DIV0425]|uniref:Uncharacterized protein n=1 Tax=Candidatus Enterococcus wittei TaxID=1987383 RepID=A0A242JYU7_9ENTE|nr:hypothetical protein [Enterococcus sp. 10A9_DIV0425]OTP10485.1 hypothetical protein A5844_002185 [Enterococcus sp. 10A9_DIV0425]